MSPVWNCKEPESQFPLVALIVLSMHDEAQRAERALRARTRPS
jgi:hypothetical protein